MDDLDHRRMVWPLFGLRVRTPRLELRPVDPELAYDLGRLATQGIHDPTTMPFFVPWTRAEPLDLERSSLQFYLRVWADFAADRWSLPLATFVDGELVGMQDLLGEQFPIRRTVTTGSWLVRAHQGRGIGTEMRSAVLHLAFAGLGAERAETEAFEENEASIRVSQRNGYVPNGDRIAVRDDAPARLLRFVLRREVWAARRRPDVEVTGLDDDALALFGLGPDDRRDRADATPAPGH